MTDPKVPPGPELVVPQSNGLALAYFILGAGLMVFGMIQIVVGPLEIRRGAVLYMMAFLALPIGVILYGFTIAKLRPGEPYIAVDQDGISCILWTRKIAWSEIEAVRLLEARAPGRPDEVVFHLRPGAPPAQQKYLDFRSTFRLPGRQDDAEAVLAALRRHLGDGAMLGR